MKIKSIQVFVDSLLITNHFNGSYSVKGEKLIKYLEILKKLSLYFEVFSITQVPREENAEADALANLASSLKIPEGTKIPIIHVLTPAIDEQFVGEIADADDMQLDSPSDSQESWMQPIKNYLNNGEIPKDENPRAFRTKVIQYTILNNILYRKSLAGPYLRCLGSSEAQEVLKDIHEGDCGNHTGGRALF
jgi:hypothetical protein